MNHPAQTCLLAGLDASFRTVRAVTIHQVMWFSLIKSIQGNIYKQNCQILIHLWHFTENGNVLTSPATHSYSDQTHKSHCALNLTILRVHLTLFIIII